MAIRSDAQPVYDGTFTSVPFTSVLFNGPKGELRTQNRERLVPDPPVATEPEA